MNFLNYLKNIKKLPYKTASVEDKFALIKSVVLKFDTISIETKWKMVFDNFSNSKLKSLVAEEYVKSMVSGYAFKEDTTLSYKADMSAILISKYNDLIDVNEILKSVFSDSYEILANQMRINDLEYEDILCKN